MKKTIKSRLVFGSLFLFTVALGINVALNSSSVDKMSEETTIAKFRILGELFEERLSTLVLNQQKSYLSIEVDRLLKRTLVQIDSLADEVAPAEGHTGDSSISVLLPDQTVVTGTESEAIARELDSGSRELSVYTREKKEETFFHYRKDGTYFLIFHIIDADALLRGAVIITVPETVVQANSNILIYKEWARLLLIFVVGLTILVSLAIGPRGAREYKDNKSKNRLSLMFFLVIFTAQIAFTVLTTFTFTEQYLKMNKEKARMRVGLLKDDVESIILGAAAKSENDTDAAAQIDREKMLADILAATDELGEGEKTLADILVASPELNDISIFDGKWHPLYIATQENAINCQSVTSVQVDNVKRTLPEWDPKYNVRLTISQEAKIYGYISANFSKKVLYNRLMDIALDSITVLVISILFLVEMMIFIFYIMKEETIENEHLRSFERKAATGPPPMKQRLLNLKLTKRDTATHGGEPTVHYGLMRPAAFLLLFGYDISMSFLPLHTEKLYAPLFGLSKDVIMGLPISVELFFVGVCILVSGIWLDKRGWHEPFIAGLFMAGVGTLYSWGAPDVLNFIVSRALTGSGYGLALMASQGYVIEYSDARSKAQGLAYLFAGIYAGSLCGGATGAMLADRYGYNSVFFTGALILFSVIAYSYIFMRGGMKKPQVSATVDVAESPPMRKVTRFLTNRIVIALVFFSSLPAAIAVVGFLNYFSPIYLNRIGASQATIGRILMIYGICLIYIGPLVSRYVDASNKKRLYIFMGCALGSMAFLTFNFVEGIIAAAISMLLLGLSSSLVLASQSAYTLRLKVTEELGAGKSIGIFRSTSRAGQVLGPIVFSSLIISSNIVEGITFFGIAYLAFAIVFLLLTMKDKTQLAF